MYLLEDPNSYLYRHSVVVFWMDFAYLEGGIYFVFLGSRPLHI